MEAVIKLTASTSLEDRTEDRTEDITTEDITTKDGCVFFHCLKYFIFARGGGRELKASGVESDEVLSFQFL